MATNDQYMIKSMFQKREWELQMTFGLKEDYIQEGVE